MTERFSSIGYRLQTRQQRAACRHVRIICQDKEFSLARLGRLLLDDQAPQIFATTDVIAERVRKPGRHNNAETAAARDMLGGLLHDIGCRPRKCTRCTPCATRRTTLPPPA